MSTDRMLDLLFTPFTALLFAVLFIVCIILLFRGKTKRTPLIFTAALCVIYFIFVLYLSLGFGANTPPAAPPAPPR